MLLDKLEDIPESLDKAQGLTWLSKVWDDCMIEKVNWCAD